MRVLLLLASAIVMVTGCDQFPGYRIWVNNTAGEERILVLTQAGSLTEGQLATYLIPADGALRETEFVVTAAPPDPLAAQVFIYDSSCKLLGSQPVSKVGGYLLKLETGSATSLELLDDSSLPTAAERMTSRPGGCSSDPAVSPVAHVTLRDAD